MRLRDPYRQSRRISILGLLGVLLVFFVGMLWLIFSMASRSFVEEENVEVEVDGIGEVASIIRDGYGIPYIVGKSDQDVAMALGYAHAQDRLWQMEISRRVAAGRLSEVFGTEYLGYDAFMRTVGIPEIADRILETMPDETRQALDAYSKGVNRFIETHEGRIPYEFDALGYEPEPWTPEASVAVVRLMAWGQNGSLWSDLLFERLAGAVDSVLYMDMLPWYPSYGPTIIPGGQRPESELERLRAGMPLPDTTSASDSTAPDSSGSSRPDSMARTGAGTPISGLIRRFDRLRKLDRQLRADAGFGGSPIGSNAWAISGDRTLSGKPLLANDPHDQQTIPAKWYQAVLITDGRPVAGVTIPGIPFVIIGRNRDVAWGLTNLMADESDLYLERLHPDGSDRVLHDGRWEDLTVRYDTIASRDSAGTPITIRSSRHGPVFSDLIDVVDSYPVPHFDTGLSRSLFEPGTDTLAIAVRWTGRDVTHEITAFQRMAKATDLVSFRKAVSMGGVPGFGVVYANRGGSIAFIPSFRAPIRNETRLNRLNPGWESRYNWRGSRPTGYLPELVDPESGYAATANNRLTNGNSAGIGELWDDPSRSIRIEEYLSQGNQLETIDCVQMQGDLVSPYMSYAVEFLLRSFPDSTEQGEKVREAIGRLRNWNGEMNADSPDALIAAAWLGRVMEMTWKDELDDDLYDHFVMLGPIAHRALRRQLMTDSRWFDNVTTSRREVRDDILRVALGEVLDSLHDQFETWELQEWTFGTLHTLRFVPPFSVVKRMERMVDIGPFEIGGAATTLNSGAWDLRYPFDVVLGPSMRQLVDFGDTNVFLRSVLATGQSGQPMNERYDDQSIIWLFNGYLQLHDTPPSEEEALSIVRLVPE